MAKINRNMELLAAFMEVIEEEEEDAEGRERERCQGGEGVA